MKNSFAFAILSLFPVVLGSCIFAPSARNNPLDPNAVTFTNWTVTTFAGSGSGSSDGNGTSASFNAPKGIVALSDGTIFVSDSGNNKIRKITPGGDVSVFAGSGGAGSADGTGLSATFNGPTYITADSNGNLYVSETTANKIRKITPSGVVSTLSGTGAYGFADHSNGLNALFSSPYGIAVNSSGHIFVADLGNQRIRIISPNGAVSTYAGNGTTGDGDGSSNGARFSDPKGLAFGPDGSLFVLEMGNHRVRKITSSGIVSTIAGSLKTGALEDGLGDSASLGLSYLGGGIAVDSLNRIFLTDNYRIRVIFQNRYVLSIAGSGSTGTRDGVGTESLFTTPYTLCVSANGEIFVGDAGNHRIRKLTQKIQ